MDITTTAFWGGLGSIIVADILLAGDNAVVIAMAARGLPPQHQRKAIVFGSAAAIVARVVLTIVAARLLELPYLKVVGGLLLLYIGVTLLGSDDDGEESGAGAPAAAGTLAAIRTILLADLAMSLDNVVAVAAAAKGDFVLLILGLAISIPFVVFGSTVVLKVMARFPAIVTFGAALLGWLAGEMIATDPGLARAFGSIDPLVVKASAVAGAILVIAIGAIRRRRDAAQAAARQAN